MAARVKLVVGAIVVMALASAITWAVAAQTMRTPAQVAAEAEAPEPGPITAPVERRTLTNEVITRGTVVYDEPVAIELTAQPDRDRQAVVTRVPEPGDTVEEGDVAVEVAGRPILVLQGELPAYRDLRPGASGDDVAQLQAGLERLGYDIGQVDGVFGPATEAGVEAWYADVGFEPQEPVGQEALERAEDERDGAANQLEQARQQLRQARQGPGGDVSAAQRAVAHARDELREATAELREARAESGTWVPVGEIEFVDELPRRVDTVEVELGDEASGELVTLTEGEAVVEADLDAEEADFVDEGMSVDLVPDDGDPLAGTVTEVADGDDDGATLTVTAEDEAAAEELVDASVRVDIPVESTDGEVLAVPLPALSVAGDGDSRVEVIREENGAGSGDADEPVTEFVTVEPGMAADGFAEIEPVDGELSEGDQVVVGTEAEEDAGESGDEEGGDG